MRLEGCILKLEAIKLELSLENAAITQQVKQLKEKGMGHAVDDVARKEGRKKRQL